MLPGEKEHGGWDRVCDLPKGHADSHRGGGRRWELDPPPIDRRDLATKVLLARNASLLGNHDEVYHQLYGIACPGYDQYEPWEEFEKLAGMGPFPEKAANPHIGRDAVAHLKKLSERVRIWSLEHKAWWCPNSMGYTTDVAQAGLYSPEEAGSIVSKSSKDEVVIRQSSSVPKCVDELMSAAIRLDPKAELLDLMDAVIEHYDGAHEPGGNAPAQPASRENGPCVGRSAKLFGAPIRLHDGCCNGSAPPASGGPARPKIVCLCGSTRFMEAFQEANLKETLAGNIVLSVGCNTKSDAMIGIGPEVKEKLDALHKQKIELSDEVLVLNVGGYIGESTRSEIEHAALRGKPIRYLEPLQ